ncbi:MAG: hypothetical protein JWR19_2596 [Pedosphaera sp.]|nr:hypothetical protein [Pedosphaera sp.]
MEVQSVEFQKGILTQRRREGAEARTMGEMDDMDWNGQDRGGFVSRLQRLGVVGFFPGAAPQAITWRAFSPVRLLAHPPSPRLWRDERGTMGLMGSQGWSRLGLKIKAGVKGI